VRGESSRDSHDTLVGKKVLKGNGKESIREKNKKDV